MHEPTAGDDAIAAEWVPLTYLPRLRLAFDHGTILRAALSGLVIVKDEEKRDG